MNLCKCQSKTKHNPINKFFNICVLQTPPNQLEKIIISTAFSYFLNKTIKRQELHQLLIQVQSEYPEVAPDFAEYQAIHLIQSIKLLVCYQIQMKESLRLWCILSFFYCCKSIIIKNNLCYLIITQSFNTFAQFI
ncbi:unnamed protein product [Paramecium pentaurelia]|uniref:Uncharacterized protein n=1 Tax=Paramecium pentaurelia TaxID=43138 RepID=A0A8S1YF44_9CILI|nr:unnamed protein product [Paramecium pentaurelia]